MTGRGAYECHYLRVPLLTSATTYECHYWQCSIVRPMRFGIHDVPFAAIREVVDGRADPRGNPRTAMTMGAPTI
jgi:hypothetical protein